MVRLCREVYGQGESLRCGLALWSTPRAAALWARGCSLGARGHSLGHTCLVAGAASVPKKGSKLLIPLPPDVERARAEAKASHDHVLAEDMTLLEAAAKLGVEAPLLLRLNQVPLPALTRALGWGGGGGGACCGWAHPSPPSLPVCGTGHRGPHPPCARAGPGSSP